MSTAQAVSFGIRSTAGVVTSAAIIMVAVFAVFGTLSMQDFKQLGVGLALAILLDATLIRVVLLPSVMALLGDRNWYLPKWLYWLRPNSDRSPGLSARSAWAASNPPSPGRRTQARGADRAHRTSDDSAPISRPAPPAQSGPFKDRGPDSVRRLAPECLTESGLSQVAQADFSETGHRPSCWARKR